MFRDWPRLTTFALLGAILAALADRSGAPAIGASVAADRAPASPLVGIGEVELVRSGFVFAEGVRWVPAQGALLLSDAYGETIYKLTRPGKLEPYRPHSNGANGLDVDAEGHVIAAEVGANREKSKGGVSRQRADGSWGDAITDYRGLAVAHPNDVVALPDGTLFFSDLGLARRLLRIDRGGALSYPLDGDDARVNGLAL
jgi:sugar lactone lactonase YvrE